MAIMYVSAQPFILRSTWINRWENGYYHNSTTPSTAKMAQLFATSAIPAGSTVQSAILKIEKIIGIGGGTFTADGTANANQVDVTDRLTPNSDGSYNDTDISFTFRAYGESGADKPKGTRTVVCNVRSVTVEITYDAGDGIVYDPEAYRTAALSPAREILPRGIITYPDGSTQPITAEHIIGYQVNEGADTGVLLGTATSARLEMNLANADGEWLLGGGMRGYRPLMGAKVTLEVGLKVDGEWVYTPAGTYVLDEMSGQEGKPVLSVGGYDDMANAMHKEFDDTLTYPATLSEVLAHIVEKSGLSVTGVLAANRVVMIPKKPDWGDECTLRQALAFVCGAGASYATMTRDGLLSIQPTWATSPVLTLNTENYLTLTHDERVFSFNRLTVTPRGANSGENDLVSCFDESLEELPSNTLYIDDNPLFVKGQSIAQTLVDGVASALSGAVWRALDTTWRGDPSVLIGTRLSLTDRSGVTRETTIMGQEIGWDNGFYMTATCGIDTQETMSSGALTGAGMIDTKKVALESIGSALLAQYAVTAEKLADLAVTMEKLANNAVTTEKLADGSVTKIKVGEAAIGAAQIENAAIVSAKIADAAITSAKIALLAVDTANIKDLAVTAAKIANAAIDSVHIKDAAITNAKIGEAAIGKANIQDLAVDTAKIALGAITQALISQGAVGTLQIADGSITDAKIVELTANKINAGTLSVERLVIVGSEESIVFAINEANGTAQLSQTTIDGGSLTERSITADRIVVGSLTGKEIAAEAITANHILAGAVTTEKLDALCVTTDKIAAETITANKLASDVGRTLDLSSNESIKTIVGDIQVGGVNLLPDSKKDRTVTGGRFLSIPVRDVLSPYVGNEISVSFEAKGTAGNVFSVYAYQSSGISIDKSYSFTMPTDAFQRFSFVTSVKDYTDRVGDDGTAYSLGEIAFYDTAGTQDFTIRKVKIELGNKPTSWSPCPDDPAEKLKTATAVLQEDEYYIAFNGNRVFHIDEDSAEVNADSMTVTGAFYANVPNTQGACTITVPDGASIQAAINDLGKNLTGSVEVKVNGYHAENVTIAGFFGQGALTVRFGSGAVLEGTLYASDCQCRLNLYGTNMTDRVIRGSTYGIQISNCSYVYVSTIGILGAERTALGVNAGTYGVRVLDGSYVQARNVLVEKCGRCFTVSRSVLGIQNCIGGVDSTDASSVANARWLVLEPDSFSIVIVCTGTIPMSSGGIYKVDGILEYNESSVTATGSSGEAAAVTTKTVTMTPSASKGAVYGTADGSGGYVHPWGYYTNPFQGKNSGAGGYMFGLWLYTDDYTAFYNTISGKTIQSATLTIKRANAYGVGGSTVHLFYHSLTSVASSQRPSEILTSTGLSAQVDRGKSVTFELTSDLIAKLQDGTIKGFGLSSAGSTQLMQFEGTVCDLTVVYSA